MGQCAAQHTNQDKSIPCGVYEDVNTEADTCGWIECRRFQELDEYPLYENGITSSVVALLLPDIVNHANSEKESIRITASSILPAV